VLRPYRNTEEDFRKTLVAAVVWAAMALYANLSTVNFYVAVMAVFGFRYYQLHREGLSFTRRQKTLYLLLTCLPFVWAVVKMILLKKEEQLYFGAESLSETFSSFIWSARYQDATVSTTGFVSCCVFMATLLISAILSARRRDYYSRLSVTTVVLLLIFCGLIAEHHLFGARYPLERTGLYLITLSAVFLFYFLKHILAFIKSGTFRTAVSGIIAALVAIPLCYNFRNTANLSYSYTWRYDANTKDAARQLQVYAIRQQKPGRAFTLSNDWIFEPSLNYYIYTHHLPFRPTNRNGISTKTDFVYTGSKDFKEAGFILVDSFSPAASRLYALSPQR
jgi:hypothetical protein